MFLWLNPEEWPGKGKILQSFVETTAEPVKRDLGTGSAPGPREKLRAAGSARFFGLCPSLTMGRECQSPSDWMVAVLRAPGGRGAR